MKEAHKNLVLKHASKYAPYDIVKFVCMDGENYIYNYTADFLLGKKTGLPHFVTITPKGELTEVKDTDDVLRYMNELFKRKTTKTR